MRRVAFSMTLDPDGAMHDWVDLPDGWALTRVPTQEAVWLLGIAGYQDLIVDLCRREQPDLLVTHPPYDYLTPAVAEAVRAAGTRLIAYAFDDEIFAADYDAATRAALHQTYDRYATTRDVRWATAPAPPVETGPVEHDVALVGRAYPRRVALVEALRGAGLRVVVRGVGWPDGAVARDELRRLYARAAVVLTTADWESRAVPMVKHRLLDAAMMGVCQVAQDAPDLRAYFPADEVASFGDVGELVAAVRAALADPDDRNRRAAAARRRALGEHTWRRRFPELIAGVPLAPPGEKKHERSFYFDGVLMALAGRAEVDGRLRAAAALYAERLGRPGDDASAAAGLGRCLRELGDLESAIPWLRRAAAVEPPTACGVLHAAIAPSPAGAGLGRLGLWPPPAEPIVYLVAALADLGRVDEAAAVLDAVTSPAVRRALAATITLGDASHLAPLRDRLDRWR